MHRRELLRLLVVAGVAGCTARIRDEDAVTGTPSTTPIRPPAEDVTSPGPAPSPIPSPSPVASEGSSGAAAPDDGSTAGAPPTDAESPPDPGSGATPTDPATDAATDAATGGRTVVAVGREALGLPAARPGGRTHTITGLAVHHTASPTAAASTAPGRFRGITRAHRELGWIDVAYHWGVDVDGNVYELRDERVAGDTRTDYDPAGWFLVVCEGNFEESTPSRAMLDAVADVLAVGAERHGIDPSTIRGHRDLAATLCPGANLQDRLPALREAVAARLAEGGVVLRVDDDPRRVTTIEAG